MAVINFINTKAKNKSALKKIIKYVTQVEKTDEKLIGGKDLLAECAYSEMVMTKKQFNKTGGRQYLHMIQYFSPKENIDHEKAHELAIELAQHFEDFQVLVATHKDKNHVHSHFVINSVNFENGLKFQQSFEQLQKVMDKSDEICKSNGFSVLEKREFGKYLSRNEYQVAMKGESWKSELMCVIDKAMEITSTKDDFIGYMNSLGYGVNWSEKRKYITYQIPKGDKCRCNRLHDKKYTKEEMERVYNDRKDEKHEQRRWSSVYKAANLFDSSKRLGRHDEDDAPQSYPKFERSEEYRGRGTGENMQFNRAETWRIGERELSESTREQGNGSELFRGDKAGYRRSEEFAESNQQYNEYHDCGNENSNWSASDIADIGYNFSSLIAGRGDDVHVRTSNHTGDLTKEGEREKALKDHNIWDEER